MKAVWHMRKRSSGFLSQVNLPLPSMATPVEGMSPFVDFFTAVNRTYEQISLSLDTAQSGYNLDVARQELSSARESRAKAFDLLRQAKVQGFISADDASGLVDSVMKPLADADGLAAEAIQRGQSFFLSYWEKIKKSLESIIIPVLNFVSSKWKDTLKAYQAISNYVMSADNLIVSLSGTPGIAQSYIDAYKIEVDKVRIMKLQIESSMQATGLSVTNFQAAAAKEAGLGQADKMILGFTVGLTVWRIYLIVRAILAAISGIGLFAAFAPTTATLVGLGWLVRLNEKREREAKEKAEAKIDRVAIMVRDLREKTVAEALYKKEVTDAAVAELKAKQQKGEIDAQIENTINTVGGLEKVISGQEGAADKLKKFFDAEKAKRGLPTGPDPAHVLLASLVGAGLAWVVYYFRKGKS